MDSPSSLYLCLFSYFLSEQVVCSYISWVRIHQFKTMNDYLQLLSFKSLFLKNMKYGWMKLLICSLQVLVDLLYWDHMNRDRLCLFRLLCEIDLLRLHLFLCLRNRHALVFWHCQCFHVPIIRYHHIQMWKCYRLLIKLLNAFYLQQYYKSLQDQYLDHQSSFS